MGIAMGPDDTGSSVEFDADRGVYRKRFEAGDDLCFSLVKAIATIENTDPIKVEPLGDFVDVDALEQIVQSSSDSCTLEMTLPEHRYHIVIQSEGVIELQPTHTDQQFTKN